MSNRPAASRQPPSNSDFETRAGRLVRANPRTTAGKGIEARRGPVKTDIERAAVPAGAAPPALVLPGTPARMRAVSAAPTAIDRTSQERGFRTMLILFS